MKNNSKKLLAAVIAMIMVLAMAMPALATGGEGGSGTANGNSTRVQITKTLKIGRGITVPTETFTFSFASTDTAEVQKLGDISGYLDPTLAQQNVSYPDLDDVTISFESNMRLDGATDTELTFLSDKIDLTKYSWGNAGLYIYSVKEVVPAANPTAGMEYDNSTFYLKVYVANDSNGGHVVDGVTVMGFDETADEGNGKWVKVNGAPTEEKEPYDTENPDGCEDFMGNGFRFVNSYKKDVDHHPTNKDQISGDDSSKDYNDWAFKLTKKIDGSYASINDNFDFSVAIVLPETNNASTNATAKVNKYTANKIDSSIQITNPNDPNELATVVDVEVPLNGSPFEVYLHHGDSFGITNLPAGTEIHMHEVAFTERPYTPSYVGKWGLDISDGKEKKKTGEKDKDLEANTIVVGENGAYIQYINKISDDDVTVTGVVISNLPYILMVAIAAAGIGFYMVSKKRRNG